MVIVKILNSGQLVKSFQVSPQQVQSIYSVLSYI